MVKMSFTGWFVVIVVILLSLCEVSIILIKPEIYINGTVVDNSIFHGFFLIIMIAIYLPLYSFQEGGNCISFEKIKNGVKLRIAQQVSIDDGNKFTVITDEINSYLNVDENEELKDLPRNTIFVKIKGKINIISKELNPPSKE